MKKAACLGMLVRMDRSLPCCAILAATLLLAGCGTLRSSVVVEPTADAYSGVHRPTAIAATPARTPVPGGSYVVMKGDTLYSIAFRQGVDFRDLAQWNGIAAPYTIWAGQRLTLSPPARTAAAPVAATPSHASAVPATAASANSAPVFEPIAPPAHSSASASAPVAAASSTPPSAKPAAPAAAGTSVVPVAGVPAPVPATLPPPAPAAAGVSRVTSGVQWRWPADGSLVGRFQSGDAIPGIEIAGKSGDAVRAAADGVVVYSGNGLVGYGELVIIKHNDSFLSAYGHNSKRLVKEGQRVSMGQQIAEMGSTGTTRVELGFQIRKDGNPVDPLGYLPPR